MTRPSIQPFTSLRRSPLSALRGQLDARDGHRIPASCDVVLSMRQRDRGAEPEAAESLGGVLLGEVHQGAETQDPEATEVGRGVAALEADLPPLVRISRFQSLGLTDRTNVPRALAGSSTDPEGALRAPGSHGRISWRDWEIAYFSSARECTTFIATLVPSSWWKQLSTFRLNLTFREQLKHTYR